MKRARTEEELKKNNRGQIEEALGKTNRYFFKETYGRDGSDEELLQYYIKKAAKDWNIRKEEEKELV